MNKRSNIDKAIDKIDIILKGIGLCNLMKLGVNNLELDIQLTEIKSLLKEDSGVEVKKPSTLKDFGYADGDYWGCCNTCAEMFTGDKRASTCSKCATYKLSRI